MIARERELHSKEEIQPMELKVSPSGRVTDVIKKKGLVTIDLCVGYKDKESEPTNPRAYFKAVIDYVRKLNYDNFFICLFPNKFDKENKVDHYMSQIQDLLDDPILEGKVFMMGGYDKHNIYLPDYAEAEEYKVNLAHATEKLAELRAKNPAFEEMLLNDARHYLCRNEDVVPEIAKEGIADEVAFAISIMSRKGSYIPAIMVSADKEPLETMKYVNENYEAALSLERARKSLRHVSCSIHPKSTLSPAAKSPQKSPMIITKEKPGSDSDMDCSGNSSGSDSDEDNFLRDIAVACASNRNVPIDRAADLLECLYYKFAEKKQLEARPTTNSTQSMMRGLASGSKRGNRSPQGSPEDSPSYKRYEEDSAQRSDGRSTQTANLSSMGFIANTNRPVTPLTSSNTVQQDARAMVNA